MKTEHIIEALKHTIEPMAKVMFRKANDNVKDIYAFSIRIGRFADEAGYSVAVTYFDNPNLDGIPITVVAHYDNDGQWLAFEEV